MYKVALRCWSSNQEYNADFDFAVVTITPELIALIEARWAIFETAHAAGNQLMDMRFWDYSPEFMAEADLQRFADTLEGDTDPEWMVSIQNGSEVEDLPDTFTFEDKEGSFAVECGRMVVFDTGVRWITTPKYCSFEVDTAELTYKDLREIAQQESTHV